MDNPYLKIIEEAIDNGNYMSKEYVANPENFSTKEPQKNFSQMFEAMDSYFG